MAIASGVGGWAGAVVVGELSASDSTTALGFTGATADLKQATTRGSTIYVFALP